MRLRCPHLLERPQTHACMRSNVRMRTCPYVSVRSRVSSWKRSRPHISAALPAHTIVSSPRRMVGRRGEQLAVTPVPRTSSGSWNLTCAVSIKQQVQRPTTERMLLADLHVALVSFCHFLETGRLSVHLYNTHPEFERGNYGKNCAYYNGIFTALTTVICKHIQIHDGIIFFIIIFLFLTFHCVYAVFVMGH